VLLLIRNDLGRKGRRSFITFYGLADTRFLIPAAFVTCPTRSKKRMPAGCGGIWRSLASRRRTGDFYLGSWYRQAIKWASKPSQTPLHQRIQAADGTTYGAYVALLE